jgi:hypothetical protein
MTPWDGGSVPVVVPAYLLPYYHWWVGGIYMAYLRNRAPRAPLSMSAWIRIKKDFNFVLIVQGHAVAVVNGVLFGNGDERYNGLYRSVWYGFEMK